MAERRMFTKKVTDDDNFMSLSSSAQALYLHLSMSSDDDGFCNQVSSSMFKAHASVQDLQALLEKRYIYQFENGVIVIKHWRMANALRKDRYTPTSFQEELAQLELKDNGSYTMHMDDCLSNEPITKRQETYKKSSLPYSFDYKIKSAFWGKKCPICGFAMATSVDDAGVISDNRIPTIQHNMPISKGGEHELGNISVICKQCNVSIQDNPTDKLNSDEVIEEWEKIVGCRLVATCLPQDSIGKDSIEKNNICHQVIEYLNQVLGTRYTTKNKTNISNINARISEGHTFDDFKQVIDKKYAQWHNDPKMASYLRPETLFCSKHFESYLNEIVETKETKKDSLAVIPKKTYDKIHNFNERRYSKEDLEKMFFGGGE